MSSEEAPAESTTKPVEAQALSSGKIKNPRLEHKCCEHCEPDAHAPHTLGCPNTNSDSTSPEDLEKAVKEAVDDMFAVSNVWAPKVVVKFKIDCPSGQTALVKHLDILDLASVGLVEDMDLFTKKLFPSKFDDQGNPVDEKESETIWDTLKDVEQRKKFLDMTGRLMSIASVKPKVVDDGVVIVTNEDGSKVTKFGHQLDMDQQLEHFGKPIPTLEDPKREAYAGYIGFADRMSYFVELQKPLGAIEPFREGSADVLESMESGERVGVPSQ